MRRLEASATKLFAALGTRPSARARGVSRLPCPSTGGNKGNSHPTTHPHIGELGDGGGDSRRNKCGKRERGRVTERERGR